MEIPIQNYLVKKLRGHTQLVSVPGGRVRIQYKFMDEDLDTRVFVDVSSPIRASDLADQITTEQSDKTQLLSKHTRQLSNLDQRITDLTASRTALIDAYNRDVADADQTIADLQALHTDVLAVP